jgi:rhamnosyltransferase
VSQTVAAVIPAYRPEHGALLTLVRDLLARDLPLLVADDASPCTADPVLRSVSEAGATVTRHRRNAGIARSLNDGLRFAADIGATWLLTVDQDSTLAPDHVDPLLRAAADAAATLGADRVGAVAAGAIDDASGEIGYPVTWRHGVATTEEVIQTGTLWAVDPLLAVGGFDERLGIDAVDAAACLSLRSAGLHVVLAPEVRITHRIGGGRQVRVLGRDVLASGHSPERRMTIVRNRLRLFPGEFAQSPTHALRTVRRVAVQTTLAVTVEDDRWAKAKAAAKGLRPRRNG